MDYLFKVLGAAPGEVQPSSGVETVERLCERVSSSTLLDDRRDAVRALKALSKKYRLEVGTQAMDILLNVLEQDRSDTEIIGYALDTLYNVMSNEPTDEAESISDPVSSDLGGQFTEIFIKRPENVSLLLSFLDDYDFHVRWPTVKLLTVMLTNRHKELQEIVLVIPMGVSRLMDLLSDSREIIRNDALLLLNQLTKGHANIQKIVAFENAFERILDIIREEGATDGGIVVEDCLLLLYNLLQNNTSNQNFFKEGSYIQKLKTFFHLDEDSHSKQGWSAQKVTNMHLLLQLVRILVSPNNPQNQTVSCQKVMNQCGLLQDLCSMLMASGVPADVLTETINTVSEVIRGSHHNQEYFASVLAPSTPPRPAIVVLLMSMVNEKQPFVLRCAVLYCFQSFLYKNELGQSQIIQTLLPTAADANSITAGQLLCGGLFSADPLSNWFAAVALLHAIIENSTQKEQLLRVQLATSLGSPPVSLLQQCCNMLSQGGKLQTRIGLLMILCAWLADCPIAVSHFLNNTANVPYLISQVSSSEGDEHEAILQGLCAFLLGICILYNDDSSKTFSKSSLKQIIQNRIGLESFTDKLTQVAQNESYTRAAKKPHLSYKHPSEIVFDYEFTRLFKGLENEVMKAVSGKGSSMNERKAAGTSMEEYKHVLREQEENMQSLRQRLEELQDLNISADRTIADLRSQVQQLKDQNSLLKAQRGSQNALQPTATLVSSSPGEDTENLRREIETLRLQLQEKDIQLLASAKGTDENKENNPDTTAVLQASLSRLQEEITTKDREIYSLQSELQQMRNLVQKADVSNDVDDSSDSNELESRLQATEAQLKAITDEKSILQERLKKANEENLKLASTIRILEEEKDNFGEETKKLKEELDGFKKEQDDLLVLLADQDTKIDKYKSQLKALGQQVEDDDDDDDDGDEGDDLEGDIEDDEDGAE